MGKATFSKNVSYEEPGAPGVGLICTYPKVSYSPLEAYATDVYLQMNMGGVSVRPNVSSLGIQWAGDDSRIYGLNTSQSYSGMRVSYGRQGNAIILSLTFDRGTTFKGTIYVRLEYNGAVFTQTIDVYPEAVPVSVDCETSVLTYNPKEASYIIFDANLIVDGVKVGNTNDTWEAYFVEDGESTQVTASRYKGVLFTFDDGSFLAHFKSGATLEGSLRLVLTSGDVSRTIVIPIVKVENGENGEDAITLVCSTSAITYNPARASIQVITSQIKIKNTYFRPSFLSATLFGTTNTIQQVFTSSGGTHQGLTLSVSNGTNAHQVNLTFAQGAEVVGVLQLSYTFNGVTYSAQISLTRVENGEQGLRGIKGAYIRGPRLWTEVKAQFLDSLTEAFYSGADEEPFIDVVVYEGRYYVCKQTHMVNLSVLPNTGGNTQWEQFSDLPFVATKLLLAERAKIDNLIADGIAMLGETDESTGLPKEIFTVTKDADNNSYVYASKGMFENVTVKGDIKCNTQTYLAPSFPDGDVHMWDDSEPEGVISVEPIGGCLIIPTGKSDYEIRLPKVEADTYRQITIVNQNLPRGGNRRCFIVPKEEGVRIFTDLASCANNDIIDYSVTNQKHFDLPYGAFSLYGYQAELPKLVGGVYQTMVFTCWSVWRISADTTTPTLSSSGYTIGGNQTLPMYNNNIIAL